MCSCDRGYAGGCSSTPSGVGAGEKASRGCGPTLGAQHPTSLGDSYYLPSWHGTTPHRTPRLVLHNDVGAFVHQSLSPGYGFSQLLPQRAEFVRLVLSSLVPIDPS